jgi:HK97 family phage major capsid protein
VGLETRVWRQPVVDTPAIPEGTALTGAFGTGAQLYDRQMANIRIAEQHADFFVRNAVVILCEERIALAVKRPEAFVKGTFDV